MAKILEDHFSDAVQELARRGSNVDPLIEELALHKKACARRAAADILVRQEARKGDQLALRIIEKLSADSSVDVVAAACNLAGKCGHCSVLEQVIRLSKIGLARGAALRGLCEIAEASPLSETVVRKCLESGDSTERYWACVYTCKKHLQELLDVLRSLVHDQGEASEYAFGWQSASIFGTTVANAALRALVILHPSSKVWTDYLDWQQSFRPHN